MLGKELLINSKVITVDKKIVSNFPPRFRAVLKITRFFLTNGVLHKLLIEDSFNRGIDIDEYHFLFIKCIERDHREDKNVAY